MSLKSYDTEFDGIILTFIDQYGRPLKDKVNLNTKLIWHCLLKLENKCRRNSYSTREKSRNTKQFKTIV